MWDITIPDYDITGLICYYISYTEKQAGWRNSFSDTKSARKSEVWTLKCEGTAAQSGSEGFVQMDSHQVCF